MATLYKRDEVWHFYFRYNHRRIRESTGTSERPLAQKIMQSRMGEILSGQADPGRTETDQTISEFMPQFEDWYAGHRRCYGLKTRTMMRRLLRAFGHLKLKELKRLQIDLYASERLKTVKPGTVNRELSLVSRMLRLAVEYELIDRNPLKGFSLPERPWAGARVLSPQDCHALVDACDQWVRPVVTLALHTGMRLREICDLRWTNVNLNQRHLHLTETKNGKARIIPLSEGMAELLQHTPRVFEWVFLSRTFRPLRYNTAVQQPFILAARRAGLIPPNLRFHDLRHTWATFLAESGVGLLTLQDMAGWSNPRMAARYAHISDRSRHEAAAKVENILNNKNGHESLKTEI